MLLILLKSDRLTPPPINYLVNIWVGVVVFWLFVAGALEIWVRRDES